MTEHARRYVEAAGAAETRDCEGGPEVQMTLAVASAVLAMSHMAMAAAETPPLLLVKAVAIAAGSAIGALAAATLSDRFTIRQRILRMISSFSAGIGISVCALWLVPGREGIDPREWIFVVSVISSFFGWHLARRFDSKADKIAAKITDAAIKRAFGSDQKD